MNARVGVSVALLAGAVLLPGRARAQQIGPSEYWYDPNNIDISSTCGWGPVVPGSCPQLWFDFWSHYSGPFAVHRLRISLTAPGYQFATPLVFTTAWDGWGDPITPRVIASTPTSFFIGFVERDPVLDQPQPDEPPYSLGLVLRLAASPSDPDSVPPTFNAMAWGPTGNVVFSTLPASTTPEPTTLVLLGSGLAAVAARCARRKRRA